MPDLAEKKGIRLSQAELDPIVSKDNAFRLRDVENPSNTIFSEINDGDSVVAQKKRGLWDTTKSFLGEAIIKPVVRGVQRFPAGVESVWQVGVDNIRNIAAEQLKEDGAIFGISEEQFKARTPEQQARIDTNNKILESMNRAEDVSIRLQKNWNEISESGFTARNPKVWQGSFMENPSWSRAIGLGMESAPVLGLASLVTFATKSPVAGAAIIGAIESAEERAVARAAGLTTKEANILFISNAVMVSALETVPLTNFMKSGAIPIKAFRGAVQEGTEEVLQSLWIDSVAKLGYDETRDLTEGLLESFIAGAVSGGTIGALSINRVKDLDKKVKDAKKKGVDVETMIDGLSEMLRNKADAVVEDFADKLGNEKGAAQFFPEEEAPKPEEVPEIIPEEVEELEIAPEAPIEPITKEVVPEPKKPEKVPEKPEISPKKPIPEPVKKPVVSLEKKLEKISTTFKRKETIAKKEVKAVQEEVIKSINESDLSLNDKAKFIKTIKNIQTKEQFDRAIPDILERVEVLESDKQSRETKTKIRKILKKQRVKKVAGKPIGKVGPVIQKVTDRLNEITKIKVADARQMIEDNIEKHAQGDVPLEVVLENKLLGLIAGSVKGKESVQLLEDIETLISTGKAIRALDEINRIEREDQFILDAINVVTSGKGEPQATTIPIEDFGAGFKGKFALLGKDNVSYVDLLRAISFLNKEQTLGEEGFDALDVVKEEIAEKAGFQDSMKEFDDLYKESYGLKKNGDLARKIANDSRVETIGTFTNADGQVVTINMSVAEARKRWMELEDPTLTETFFEGMRYTPEIISGINNFLSPKDKDFARKELAFYKRYYPKVNSVYERVNGVSLPFNEFYSPIRRENVKGDEKFSDLLQDIRGRSSTAPGSLKSRIKNLRRIAEQNDYSVAQKHIRDMEHFMAFAEKIRFLRKVYSDTGFQNAVRERFGSKVLKDINGFVEDFTRGSIKDVGAFENLEKWRQNFVTSVLMIKPSLTLKQLTSFPAFADAIPVGNFTSGLIDFWKNPIKNTTTLMGSDFMRTRGKSFTRDLSLVANSSAVERFRKNPSWLNSLIVNMELAKQIGLKNIELGDKAAIIFGGWSVYKYHLDKTGSHEKAIEEFSKISNATQQSAFISQQSKIQRGGFFHRLITMFKSTPNQYFRAELNAIKGIYYQKGSRRQHIKTLLIFHVILPNLFQWVSNGFDFDEEEHLRATVLGSQNGWFLIGDALDTLMRSAMGLKQWSNDNPIKMVGKDIGTAIKILSDDEITNEDFVRATRSLADVAGTATGVGFKQAIDMGSSFNDFKEGQYEAGMKKALGYSPFVVKQGLTDKKESRTEKISKKTKKKKSRTQKLKQKRRR